MIQRETPELRPRTISARTGTRGPACRRRPRATWGSTKMTPRHRGDGAAGHPGGAAPGDGTRLRAAGLLLPDHPSQLLAEPPAGLGRPLAPVEHEPADVQPLHRAAYRRVHAGRVRWQPAASGVTERTGRVPALP